MLPEILSFQCGYSLSPIIPERLAAFVIQNTNTSRQHDTLVDCKKSFKIGTKQYEEKIIWSKNLIWCNPGTPQLLLKPFSFFQGGQRKAIDNFFSEISLEKPAHCVPVELSKIAKAFRILMNSRLVYIPNILVSPMVRTSMYVSDCLESFFKHFTKRKSLKLNNCDFLTSKFFPRQYSFQHFFQVSKH